MDIVVAGKVTAIVDISPVHGTEDIKRGREVLSSSRYNFSVSDIYPNVEMSPSVSFKD